MTKKRKLLAGLVLGFCIMSMSIPAFAATSEYNWSFGTTSTTMIAQSGKKNDSEQRYYLSISTGNPSSANVFGARVRRSSDAAEVSPYVLHTSLKTSQPYAYSSAVNTSTVYEFRGKKDTSSTAQTALAVKGKITY